MSGFRPLALLGTQFWGFVVVYGTKIVGGKLEHSLTLYSVNGDLIRTVGITAAVVKWSTFTTVDGFDLIVMADSTGNCFLFEAFWGS
jgi:hypothetical protein